MRGLTKSLMSGALAAVVLLGLLAEDRGSAVKRDPELLVQASDDPHWCC